MTSTRDAQLDVARGIAIIAIVLGHVLRGLGAAGVLDDTSDLFLVIDRCLYTVDLALFAFVSGLFVARPRDRDGALVYLRKRLSLFVYLYLLWMLLQGAVKLVTATLVNEPTSIQQVLRVWLPEGQLWFFPFLAVMTVAFATWTPWRSRAHSIIAVVFAVAISLTAWGLNGVVAGTIGLGLTAFFAVGVVYGADRFRAGMARIPLAGQIVLAIVATAIFVVTQVSVGVTPPTIDGDARTAGTVAAGVLAAVAGVAAALALSNLIARVALASTILAFFGRRSLEIFIAHIIAASGTRIALQLAGIDDLAVHVVAGLVAGLGGPLALWWITSRIGFPWLFAVPRAISGERPREVAADAPEIVGAHPDR